MKRILIFILSLITLAVTLSACGHSHKGDPWTSTVDGHYQLCEKNGEKINEGEHIVDDDNICLGCGARVEAYRPDGLEITVYNEYGLAETKTEYRAEKKISCKRYDYTIESGEPVAFKSYDGMTADTVLLSEGIVMKEDGEYYRLSTKWYYGEAYELYTYTEDGLCIRWEFVNEEGESEDVYTYTYEKNADGSLNTCTAFNNGKVMYVEKYTKDKDGKDYVCEETDYYSNGEIAWVTKRNADGYRTEEIEYSNGEPEDTYTYQYDLDERGERLSSKKYDADGTLISEVLYKYPTYKYAEKTTEVYEERDYFSDGEKYVYVYDDYGDIVLTKEADADGNTVREIKTDYTRDELGRVILKKKTENGVLSREYAYEYEDDELYAWSKETRTDYDSDGSKRVSAYWEDGRMISYAEYDADGELVCIETMEYELDEDGNVTCEKTFVDGVLTEEIRSTYDESGNVTCEKTFVDGVLIREIRSTYDEDGNERFVERYENGVLAETITYSIDEEQGHYESNRTEYYEDGGKRSYDYDENGNLIKYVEYDADGNYLYYTRYEMTVDADGNEIRACYDENGTITEREVYSVDEDGEKYKSNETQYYEDGGKVSIDYDENGSIVLDVRYDADGNYLHYFRYEDVFNDDGTRVVYTKDENDKLLYEYRYDGDGNVLTETQYVGDEKIVYTHREDGTVLREVFDSNGNLTSSTVE